MPQRETAPGFVLVANQGSPRVTGWKNALARYGRPPAQLVTYADLLSGRVKLPQVVREGDVVRLDSPGRDWPVERALLELGAEAAWDESVRDGDLERLSSQAVRALDYDKGRLLASRQWFLGWCALLQNIESQLRSCPPHRILTPPADVALMFDKPRCHARLEDGGVSVPRALGSPRSYDDLVARMSRDGCRRVFVKLAHGSSASGIVAYRTNGTRHEAATTVETTSCEGEAALYNSRRIRVLRDEREIALLIDALCRHRVHVEQWLPKASLQGQACDLRVVVIEGRARHTVVRRSQSPMTNLHLLNERGNLEALRALLPKGAWESAMATCEAALSLFPQTLCGGVDLLLTPGWKRHAVLEVNAFGDLLPGIESEGENTYSAQVRAVLEG